MTVYGEGRYRCAKDGLVTPGPRAVDRLARAEFEPACPLCGADLCPEPVPEAAGTDPRNVYAATKLHQEHLCASYARESGTMSIALRYHNVYGARMPRDTPYAGVASLFLSAIAAGRAPTAHGLRTAYIDLGEASPGRALVHLRISALDPALGVASDCTLAPTGEGSAYHRSWLLDCGSSLDGHTLSVRGLGPISQRCGGRRDIRRRRDHDAAGPR